ncbi:MAG TPA: hypothetical protein DCE41_14175 [Cytophagales bacterium]|nr:hypothetical protein [Cytophagales bacterium]HAA23488.1 hypothetical protein [Cytophagales bacterium]HAP61176.1 hypothetical protein [Cytophagales bacterium]
MEIIPLEWFRPQWKEDFPSYASKLREQIKEDEPFSLLGVSMGGMIVTELAKITQPQHTFLIGSAKIWTEVPTFYRYIRWSPFVIPYPIWQYFFMRSRKADAAVDPTQLESLLSMIKESDGYLFRWATTSVLRWRNEVLISNLSHMHGDQDPIFPKKYVQPHIWVPGGSHYLINSHQQLIKDWIYHTLNPSAEAPKTNAEIPLLTE